jgi:hypothetical protein
LLKLVNLLCCCAVIIINLLSNETECIGLLHLTHFTRPSKIGSAHLQTRWGPDGHPKPDGFGFKISPVCAGVSLNFHPNHFCYGSDFCSTRPIAIPTSCEGSTTVKKRVHYIASFIEETTLKCEVSLKLYIQT